MKAKSHGKRRFRLDTHSISLKKITTKNHWKENFKTKYKPQEAGTKVP